MTDETNCSGCRKPVVFARTETGGTVPLDPRAPVYLVVPAQTGLPKAVRTHEYMVTHFATCTRANDFAKVSRREEVLVAALAQALVHVPEHLRGQSIFEAGREAINASLKARGAA